MGNSQSHGTEYPLPKFNENEYEQLKSIVGNAEQKSMNEFIPVSTELIKEKLPNFTERFRKALEKSLSSVSLTFETTNEILSRSTLLKIIEGLCKPKESDPEHKLRKRFIQLYASTFSNEKDNENNDQEKIDTNKFIQELASTALTYYVAAVPKVKIVEEDGVQKETIKEGPPPKFIEASNRIVNFILRDIKKVSDKEDLTKPVTFDDDKNENEDNAKINEPVVVSWEELIQNSSESSVFNLLWDIAFCSAFITTPVFKAKNLKNYRLKSMTKPRLNPNRSRLLKPEDLFVIDLSIPSFHINTVWNQIYDSSSSGENWTVFANCIEDQGSTIVIVK
ncbi:hypothetical protein PIROE2DRAFT_1850, partial [Piromyces sp. E2]